MSTTSRRFATTAVAAATVTALTTAAAAPAPLLAPAPAVSAQVRLAASVGVYPIGPIPQAFRTMGMGTAQDFLSGVAGLARIVPGDAGRGLKQAVENLADLVAALQTGINLPLLGNLSIPEIAVPPMGPAGTVDQINTLQWSALTQGTLSAVKTAMAAGDGAAVIIGLLGDIAGIDTDIIETLVADLPLNVPGTWDGPFFSKAGKFAIVPAIGLGGTNFAVASPTLLSDPAFAQTAILAIALRNPSRTGGGILSLLNPLSSTVGLNLSNADGTASHKGTNNWGVPTTVMDGNVTVWDFGAAYDIVSDAPSTLLSPLAWLNSGVGMVMPTYLLPPNVDALFEVIGDLTGGTLGAGTINDLLATVDVASLLHIDVGADGNLYVTYDSGRLPLLEPLQFLPRTLSYIPGFGFSTTVSDSFADVLTQLVAQGYQDVNMTVDAEGVATFTRGFDMAGTQAKFWQSPVSWQMGMETPQTVFNSIITGLQDNLLDPDKGEFEVLGNKEIGNLFYRNAVSVTAAQFVSQALEQVRDALNPMINGVQGALNPIAKALDDATAQANSVIGGGCGAVTDLGVDLNGPMLDANRLVNQVGDGVNNGIHGLFGLKPVGSPPALKPADAGGQQRTVVATSAHQVPAVTDTKWTQDFTMIDLDIEPALGATEPTSAGDQAHEPAAEDTLAGTVQTELTTPVTEAAEPTENTRKVNAPGDDNGAPDETEKATHNSPDTEGSGATEKRPATTAGRADRYDDTAVAPEAESSTSVTRRANTMPTEAERNTERIASAPMASSSAGRDTGAASLAPRSTPKRTRPGADSNSDSSHRPGTRSADSAA